MEYHHSIMITLKDHGCQPRRRRIRRVRVVRSYQDRIGVKTVMLMGGKEWF